MGDRRGGVIVRVYRRLLALLLPRSFRRRHGAEMVDTFAALYAQGRQERGLRGGARAAARELRDLLRLAREQRTAAGAGLAGLRGDLRMALRQLRRAPLLAALIVALFAVGVGASGALYGAVDALLLRPLPLPDDDRIVAGVALYQGKPFTASGHDASAWTRARSFAVSGVATLRSYAHGHPRGSHRIEAAHVTPGYLEALGMEPLLGRGLREHETRTALIGYRLWQADFGGSAGVVGEELTLAGEELEIVGVAPPRFDLPWGGKQVWIPLPAGALEEDPGGHRYFFAARLRPGVDVDTAAAEIAAAARRLERELPDTHDAWTAAIVPYRTHLLRDIEGRVRTGLGWLAGAVAFLLLISCANAANLTLVRILSRRREITVRAALGAGRGRLSRLIVVETVVLATIGAVPAALAASAMLPLVARVVPVDTLAFEGTLLDLRLGTSGIAVCLLVATCMGLATGGLVASHAGRSGRALPDNDRAASPGRQDRRRISGLVLAEVALATLLLVGAGMALRGFQNLRSLDMGFDPDGLLVAHLEPPLPRYGTPEARHQLADRVVARLRDLPGTIEAGWTTDVPLGDFSWSSKWTAAPASEPVIAADRVVTDGYLEALGADLLAGRLLADELDASGGDALRPIVVTSDLARQLWPDGGAIGRRVYRNQEETARIVVGVVAPIRDDPHTFRRQGAAAYHRYDQSTLERIPKLLIRHAGDPAAMEAAVRAAVASVDPDIPVFDVRPLDEQIAERTAADRFMALAGAVVAAVGLLVAVLGIHGVLAWLVTARRREIGIRMALGADRLSLFRTAAVPAIGLTGAGMAVGLGAAYGLGGAIASNLYRVPATDLTSIGTTAGIFLAVALVVAWRATRRAMGVNPVAALTHD